jgi:hypothetical protein
MALPDAARARLAAHARIRRRVIAATLATFALAWGVIAHDGSMGSAAATTADSRATTSATDDEATTSATGDNATSSATGDTSDPVTTAQS